MDMTSPIALPKSEALALRYGPVAMPDAGPWNDHIALLLSHRSVRGYRPDALPPGTLETLVAAAQSAATSSNMQTWSVISVSDPATKAEFAKISNTQKHIEQCPLFLVWLADLSRNDRLGTAEGVQQMEVMPYLETFLVAAVDAAMAAQNAVVAAESLGLATVYIGAMRNDPQRVAELLGLPPGVMGVFGLCVGYAAPEVLSEVKPRLSQPAVLFHGTYGNPEEPALRAAYDAQMADFSQRNGMGPDSWTKRVLSRMGRLAGMSGREKLSGILHAMGFPLR
ncbi:MAG: NADPH-dependent oxidoreductase [Rubritepida sp.]|nr:NADPH-dependent oxidoreductase [Rubritepida sp.]